MIARLLTFDPYALFIAYGLILCVLCMIAAAGDVYFNRRSHR